jgi:hypothetical protein
MQNPGHCNKCCRGPFCNYECSSVGGLLASTVEWLNIPTTTSGWNIISRPMITTTPPLWQHIPSTVLVELSFLALISLAVKFQYTIQPVLRGHIWDKVIC